MTDTSGPWDSVPWAEAEWYRYLSAALPSGVVGTPAASVGAGDLPWSASGLTVTIGVGRAWVGGGWFDRDAAAALPAVTANAHASWDRIDRIVLRRDTGTHTTTITRIQGTPAATPVAPAITRSDATWDLELFSFKVPHSSGTTLSSVTDERTWLEDGAQQRRFLTGSESVTSNGSGNVTVTHGLGVTPDYVDVTFKTVGVRPYGWSLVSKTATQFTYRTYYDNGVAASNSHSIDWFVAVNG